MDYTQDESQRIGDIRYTYNNASQLTMVEEKLESASDYTVKSRNVYNGEGQRVRQYNEAGEYERYFYMGGALAFTTGSSTDYVPSENILGPDGRIIASKRGFKEIYENPTESAYQFYHYDMQASVGSIVLGEEGAAGYRYTERNQYDPFGKQNESTSFSEVENNIKYGGSMSDSSGLYYMGARHYDPNVGRFLQQDSYKGDRYSPWTQNLYTYTSNNPVNYIDPTGHSYMSMIEAYDQAYMEQLRSDNTNMSIQESLDILESERIRLGGVMVMRNEYAKTYSWKRTNPAAYGRAEKTYSEMASTAYGIDDKITEKWQQEYVLSIILSIEVTRENDHENSDAVAETTAGDLAKLRDFTGIEFGLVIGNFHSGSKLGKLRWSTKAIDRIEAGFLHADAKEFAQQVGIQNLSYSHTHPYSKGLLKYEQSPSDSDKAAIWYANEYITPNLFMGGGCYVVSTVSGLQKDKIDDALLGRGYQVYREMQYT